MVERKQLDHVPLPVVTKTMGGSGRFPEPATFWRMAKSRKHTLEEDPFLDGLLDWMGSAEGQEHIEMSDALWPLLEDVKLDANQRKFVWPDGKRLSFDKSARQLQQQLPDFKLEEVKEFLIDWIDGYAPEGMTQEQLDEFDSTASAWADKLRK
jgi:hypothetical protein